MQYAVCWCWSTEESRDRDADDRDIDENSDTCRAAVNKAARYVKDTTEQVTPVTAEVPDATDSLNNEFERVKEGGGAVLRSPRRARAAATESRNRS